jgi:hypothetical protein
MFISAKPVCEKYHNFQSFSIPYPLFFSENVTPASSAPDTPVPWDAFPLMIERQYPNDSKGAWKASEALLTTNYYAPDGKTVLGDIKYRLQDEYCEWRSDVSTKNQIIRISFTAEGPEYWIYLHDHDPEQVLQLYRTYISAQVQPSELIWSQDVIYPVFGSMKAGAYNPNNIWNTEKGVMDLTHPTNTLGAEINLTAQATDSE